MAPIQKKQRVKRGLGIRVLLKVLGVIAAIVIAGTMLLSSSGYVPLWWFRFLEKLQRILSKGESKAGIGG